MVEHYRELDAITFCKCRYRLECLQTNKVVILAWPLIVFIKILGN